MINTFRKYSKNSRGQTPFVPPLRTPMNKTVATVIVNFKFPNRHSKVMHKVLRLLYKSLYVTIAASRQIGCPDVSNQSYRNHLKRTNCENASKYCHEIYFTVLSTSKSRVWCSSKQHPPPSIFKRLCRWDSTEVLQKMEWNLSLSNNASYSGGALLSLTAINSTQPRAGNGRPPGLWSSSSSGQSNLSAEVRIVLYSVIFLLSFVGNTLVIATLFQNRRMRTLTNVLLLNLSISDLLLAVFCMPFTLIPTLLKNFIFGKTMCVLVRYMQG